MSKRKAKATSPVDSLQAHVNEHVNAFKAPYPAFLKTTEELLADERARVAERDAVIEHLKQVIYELARRP